MKTSTATTEARPLNDEVQALWQRYRATGDRRLRDQLVLTFSPLVKYIVYKKIRELPPRCEVEDFISCGLEALIRSIDRYDPEKGATLEQFAWTRVHGAILDELRRQDWAPRSVRRREREMTQARDHFTGVHGRPPTRGELADALAMSTAELRALEADISRSDVGSLNATVLHDENDAIERIDTVADEDPEWDPQAAASREQAKERLRAALRTLPPREQEVAVMLYVVDLTQREVGEILNVTESRISQIHTQLRKTLRTALAGDALLFGELAA